MRKEQSTKVINVDNLFQRGQEYLEGNGCRANPGKAMHFFRICAQAGHPGAQYYLGMLLRNDQTGEHDMEEAVQWLKRAANQGHVEAQYEMGAAYKLGEGVRKNRILALKWFLLAEWNGDPDADIHCALLSDQLSIEQEKRAAAKALRWKLMDDMKRAIEQVLNSPDLFLPCFADDELEDFNE